MLEYRAMTEADLDQIMAIEEVIYTYPWSRGNFTDTLRAGGHGWIMSLSGVPIGYAVLSTGAGEAHLLNMSIAVAWQRRGYGREILAYVQRSRLTSGRLYLDVGTNEGVKTLRDARTLNRVLRRKGYKADSLRYLELQGHQHREADWAWRLPHALEFLLQEG